MVSAVATIPIREQLVDAVGNGARTVTAIAEATGLTKQQVNANICHLKNDGTVVTTADGFTLRAGHKMPVKVTKPKPGEAAPDWVQKPTSERTFRPVSQKEMGCALSPSERALLTPTHEPSGIKSASKDSLQTEPAGIKSSHPEIPDSSFDTAPATEPSPELIAAQHERIAAQEAAGAIETPGRLPEVTEQPPRAAAVESKPAQAIVDAPGPAFVATFGEYVVIRQSEFDELVRAAKVIMRWETRRIEFDVPQMAADISDEESAR